MKSTEMSFTLVAIFATTWVRVAFSSPLATVTPAATTTEAPGCMTEGKYYANDAEIPTVCGPCRCMNGDIQCPVFDCFPFLIPCVDYVHSPDACCPICPNGHNCRAPDGTIIPAGKRVQIGTKRECWCTEQTGFTMEPQTAICKWK